MFVTVNVTLLFNRKLLHTFEIFIRFFFCEYVQQIAGKTSQLIGFWLFLRFVNGAIFFRGEREGRLMLPANNVFL